jgi:hypothetical protein
VIATGSTAAIATLQLQLQLVLQLQLQLRVLWENPNFSNLKF